MIEMDLEKFDDGQCVMLEKDNNYIQVCKLRTVGSEVHVIDLKKYKYYKIPCNTKVTSITEEEELKLYNRYQGYSFGFGAILTMMDNGRIEPEYVVIGKTRLRGNIRVVDITSERKEVRVVPLFTIVPAVARGLYLTRVIRGPVALSYSKREKIILKKLKSLLTPAEYLQLQKCCYYA